MAYRKIHIDNKKYEYQIGKVAIKVKGFPIIPITGEGLMFPCNDERYAITPSMVKAEIQKMLTVQLVK